MHRRSVHMLTIVGVLACSWAGRQAVAGTPVAINLEIPDHCVVCADQDTSEFAIGTVVKVTGPDLGWVVLSKVGGTGTVKFWELDEGEYKEITAQFPVSECPKTIYIQGTAASTIPHYS